MAGMRLIEKDRENSRWQTFTGILFKWEKMSVCCSLADLFLSYTHSNCHLVCIPGYKHIYNHRVGWNRGGVLILISNELTSRRCDDLCLNEATIECCCAEIKLPKQNLLVSSIYRPPNTSAPAFNIKFEKLVTQIQKKQSSCIVGLDHNLDLIKSHQYWPTQDFLQTVLHHGLIPCVTRPTRITNTSATLIDNIIVSRDIYNAFEMGIKIVATDHWRAKLWLEYITQNRQCEWIVPTVTLEANRCTR